MCLSLRMQRLQETAIDMATSPSSEPNGSESPDPASHATNIYDATSTEGEWEDETDDDDMDFEPTTDESEDAEFFDPTEDVEAEFHGIILSQRRSSFLCGLAEQID